jgi:hypothetical protein
MAWYAGKIADADGSAIHLGSADLLAALVQRSLQPWSRQTGLRKAAAVNAEPLRFRCGSGMDFGRA